jgi:hypothetical protein
LSLDGAGSLFFLADLFKPVISYLKGVKENREVTRQLESVLQSLHVFGESVKASMKSGKEMLARVDKLDPPIDATDIQDLMLLSVTFFEDFRMVLSSICQLGKECRDLNSGEFEGFMQKVKTRKPDVYDIMNFFGKNYDPKTGLLDLTRLPTLFRVYGKVAEWKESKEISKVVAKGGEKVDRLIEKAEAIRKQPRVHVWDRHLSQVH